VRLDQVTGRIDFGDGTGAHTLTLQADGRFAATHVYATAGSRQLTVTLTDTPGATATRTVTEAIS
jgi:PKD domain-containing protein